MRQIPVFINPLDYWTGDHSPTPEEILSFMSTPGVASDSQSIQARYRDISRDEPRLFAPPAEERILNQLVWPLRHAKAAYMVGNYLATIALAGIVAEMTAILLFDLIEASLNNKPMTEQDEERLFGRSFDKLDQSRRIEVLRAYGVLSQAMVDAFGRLRGTRKQHLHLAELRDLQSVARDARQMFRDAVMLVAMIIGQDVRDGKIELTPQMMRYLERVGKAPRPASREASSSPKGTSSDHPERND